MLERFTDPALEVLVLAEVEARQLSHDHIGPEHILLGLIDEKQGTGAAALDRLGIAPDAVRAQVEEIVGPGQQVAGDELSFDPGGKGCWSCRYGRHSSSATPISAPSICCSG